MRISDWSSDVCSSDLDGDPLDALVVARSPFIPGSVVKARPVGVLKMEDEKGGDEKLLCVPVDSPFPYYRNIQGLGDLLEIVIQQIQHLFANSKDLQPGPWVHLQGRDDAALDRETGAP